MIRWYDDSNSCAKCMLHGFLCVTCVFICYMYFCVLHVCFCVYCMSFFAFLRYNFYGLAENIYAERLSPGGRKNAVKSHKTKSTLFICTTAICIATLKFGQDLSITLSRRCILLGHGQILVWQPGCYLEWSVDCL